MSRDEALLTHAIAKTIQVPFNGRCDDAVQVLLENKTRIINDCDAEARDGQ